MSRISKTEQAAMNYCAYIKEVCAAGSHVTLTVEWKKNKTWGQNPRIDNHMGEKCCSIGGCGYDKESAALSGVLRHLGETEEERNIISRTSGTGVQAVLDALFQCGYLMKHMVGLKHSTIYEIRNIAGRDAGLLLKAAENALSLACTVAYHYENISEATWPMYDYLVDVKHALQLREAGAVHKLPPCPPFTKNLRPAFDLLTLLTDIAVFAQNHSGDEEAWGPRNSENLRHGLEHVSYVVACFLAQNTVDGAGGVDFDVVLDKLVGPVLDKAGWMTVMSELIDSYNKPVTPATQGEKMNPKQTKYYYVAEGSVRGCCSHKHRTVSAAAACAQADAMPALALVADATATARYADQMAATLTRRR